MKDIPVLEVNYFTSTDCSVCKVLKPKIEALLSDNFPDVILHYIDIENEPLLASRYSVFTIPVLIILLEGREHTRFVRSFSVDKVRLTLERLKDLIG